jgi:hypothetical protein
MENKEQKDEKGSGCKDGCGCGRGCCAGKAAFALVLLLIGGLIGFAIGHRCGGYHCMVSPCPMGGMSAPAETPSK